MFSLKNLTVKAALASALFSSAIPAGAETFVGDREDFRDETIYFAMTTRFYDGDPMNNVCGWDHQDVQAAYKDPDWRGDFKGLIDKLDYIKALGFTAIWITPIVQNASGTDFHGYHAMDFSKVDLRYESRTEWGSEEDVTFQSLIDAAHAKGMKIILDIVLNHTSNFGEATLNPLFTRSEDIRNQANVSAAVIPNYDRLPSNYNDLEGKEQYNARFKYFKNPQFDTHNYYHHYATGWNWDYPNRWWGQIAGDCVDLNTENQAVSDYLVKCYGEFIKMGVDGFRIDTTGHISRLTFNKSFIPQFHAIAEEYKSKRLNGCPFFMFGECCARYSEVTYRGQHNLSSYFYTWKSPEALLNQWNEDASWWDSQVLNEGHDSPVGNMALCEKETEFNETSDNVFLKNGQWHEPDYSKASGFSIIDFPMHYNFNNAGAAIAVAKKGDHFYNDASYNVVYVDSHDYCPGPNDLTRFNGSTEQWAENMSLMFTFRGIPCIYYGSEVEFQKGKKVDAGGTDMPVSESGRAYFGHYLEGEVSASDFGEYTASGNVATTLDGDLAHHVRRLNQIRAAVPALRKGQYTFDGCSGNYAYKRAYKDSYALVCLNGGATFSNVPEGTYTDIITGQTYQGGGSITVSAPNNMGQLRVLVKDWKGGIVGTDGKFIYAKSPVSHKGSVSFTDPGTDHFYTAEDAPGEASVSFSPAGGSFRTETLTVTASLNETAVSGWYQVAGDKKVTLSGSTASTFTIGADMNYGDTKTVTWGALSASGSEINGTLTYKKVDPNAAINIYVTGCDSPNVYAWGKNAAGTEVYPCGAWPGKTLTDKTVIDGREFYYVTIDDMDEVNIIFNKGGNQTGDISGVSGDVYYQYDGNSTATPIDVNVTPVPKMTFSPNGGDFIGSLDVKVSVANATSAWYKVGNKPQVNIDGNSATFTLGGDMLDNESVTVTWSATNGTETRTGAVTYRKVAKIDSYKYTVYLRNTANWAVPYVWIWNSAENFTGGNWPGKAMTQTDVNGQSLWMYSFTSEAQLSDLNVIFSNNGKPQTVDLTFVNNAVYNCDGQVVDEIESGVNEIGFNDETPVYFNLQGVRVENPTSGIYLVKIGNKVMKTRVR